MRNSGILLPVFSLPSEYGIGCFSQEAYDFIDFLAKSDQKYWQILPLVIPGECESPYSSPSTFAGNPLFIDLESLVRGGMLTKNEIDSYDWDNSDKINYEKVKLYKGELLRKAYLRSNHKNEFAFKYFCNKNAYWLNDYAKYMSEKNGYKEDYYKFEQYHFDVQWSVLKSYARFNGIKIIGDLPIYVSLNSVEVTCNPELFELDENKKPINIAGCPPDMSSEDGQVWGNPLYNWDKHAETNYEWWVKRVKRCFELHDVVRLDHFRGFYDYFAIPNGDRTAKNGEWRLGPGIELFEKIQEELGDVEFIAEDLGILSQGVYDLMEETGFPGMKIMQYAFNGGKDNPYLPENITENCIVYTGTHDNNTTLGWYNNTSEWEKKQLQEYIPKIKNISWDLIELAMKSRAKTCIIPMQDYLELDADSRTNTPGTININWMWRMTEIPNRKVMNRIKRLVKKYKRL